MSSGLSISLLVFGITIIITTFYFLRNGRLPVKFSLLWLFAGVIILLIVVFPNFMIWLQHIFGFITMSNFVIGILIAICLFLTMSLTIIVSGQRKKITLLFQEISILKKRVRELEDEQ